MRDSWAFGYDAAGNRQSATRSGAPGSTAQAMTAAHNTMNQITTLGGGGRTLVAGSINEPGQVAVGIAGQGDHPARMLAGNRFETELDLPTGTSTLQITATDPTGNTSQKQYTVATAPQTARTVSHDADGNMTSDGVRTYEWDAWSRLTKITWATGKSTDISYNALGQRSKLVHTDGGTTRTEYFIFDGSELLQRRTGGTAASNTDRVYFAQGERRKVGSAWTNHHYTRDHLGSVREVLASNGTLLARYDYTLYGERETRYEASGYEGTDFGFTGHITLKSPVAGQQELVLAHFRAYDPVIGRWLSQDPIREAGGVNLYGYVGGGVASVTDLLGLVGCEPPVQLTTKEVEDLKKKFSGLTRRDLELSYLHKSPTGKKILKFLADPAIQVKYLPPGSRGGIGTKKEPSINLPPGATFYTIAHEAQHLSEVMLGTNDAFANTSYEGDVEFGMKAGIGDYSAEYRAVRIENQLRKEMFKAPEFSASYHDKDIKAPLPPGTLCPK